MRERVPPLTSLSLLASSYDVILCDVWGVIHNGAALYPAAREALTNFRELGGSVILLSNASRLSAVVIPELERLGMDPTDYDALITSGDISREFLSPQSDISVFDVGPGSARGLCEGLDVRFTAMEDADIAVCAGAFQNRSKAIEELRPVLRGMLGRKLLLLCANPDVVTQLGERRVQCSGALAELYAEMGGPVLYAGKPHAAIFERALALASAIRGSPVARERVLVVGDSLRTDIAGALSHGLGALFVGSGIHAQELGVYECAARGALQRLFHETGITPTAVTWRLAW